MAKQPAEWRQREWVDDGRGAERLASGRPAQVQGTVQRDARAVRPGQQAHEQYYPAGEQSNGGILGALGRLLTGR